jgi:hypothetical protein
MEVKVAAVAAIQSPPAKQPWPKRAELDERGDPIEGRPQRAAAVYSDDGMGEDMAFDSASIRVAGDGERPMTVKELSESTTAVERTEERGQSAVSGERVSTADLVRQMIAQGGGQVATASVKPKRQRAAARKSGKGASA